MSYSRKKFYITGPGFISGQMLVANTQSGDKPRSLLVWVMSYSRKTFYNASPAFTSGQCL
jgi:hypothetical protein